MQFNDYVCKLTAMGDFCRIKHKDPHQTAQKINEFVMLAGQQNKNTNWRALLVEKSLLACEADWIDAGRPYYNIWPSVLGAFRKIDLGRVRCSDLRMPLPQLIVRFPAGHEIHGIRSMFISVFPYNNLPHAFIVLDDRSYSPVSEGRLPTHTIQSMTLMGEQTIEERLAYGIAHPYCDLTDGINQEAIYECMKIFCTVCLLGDNPDLIEPEPLNTDREKWEATHDITLIERAKRKHKYGFDVGRKIVAAPGYRNPHFAIRWMGRGKEVQKKPVLRPVKGCLVQRGKLLEMPTGYLDEEIAEINEVRSHCAT